MTPKEIARVQGYLRQVFNNGRIMVDPPGRPGAPVEVRIGNEFLGVLHRDDEDGEVSYALQISILEEDLPTGTP